MKKNVNKSNNEYFDFLASTLSFSNVITWNGDREEETRKAEPVKNEGSYFDFLADTLSICRVVA